VSLILFKKYFLTKHLLFRYLKKPVRLDALHAWLYIKISKFLMSAAAIVRLRKPCIFRRICMPFAINYELCARCGSCIGNCPNRAIIRREDKVIVTDMCCDCGMCARYCPVGALGMGAVKAELNTAKLAACLKEKLGLSRGIAAMKFADKAPGDVPVEEGPQFWCAICGDIFEGQDSPLFFTSAASMCGGCANMGLGGKRVTREEFDAALEASVVGEGNLYATLEPMTKNRDVFPRFRHIFQGMIIGALEKIDRPDLVLFPATPEQLAAISTAFAFDTGEVITGFAGKSTCLMTIPAALVDNRPVFTAGDHGGRTFMRLKNEELLVCFPFRLIPGLVKNLDKTLYAQHHEQA
jgi:uncharacterized protein (DUF169 family)/NAD-dependent dihydropyrimidine dehydrogenase PreA subunit